MRDPFPRIISLAAVTIGVGLASCESGSGVETSQDRRLDGFNYIHAQLPARYEIVEHEQTRVRVTADDNLIDQVATFVSGDTLYVASEGKLRPKVELVVRISAPNLQGISAADAGALRARGLRAERFELDLEGDTAAILEGKVGTLELKASGSPTIDASALRARDASLTLSGKPRVALRATGQLRVTASGGQVHYLTRPAQLDERTTGDTSVAYMSPQDFQRQGMTAPSPARKGRGKQEQDDPLAAYRDSPPSNQENAQEDSSGQGLDAFGDEPSPRKSTRARSKKEAPKASEGFSPDAFGDEDSGTSEQRAQDEPRKEEQGEPEGGLSLDAFGEEEDAEASPEPEPEASQEEPSGGFSPDDFDG